MLRAVAEGGRERARLLEERLARRGGLLEELGRERVKLLEAADLVVEEPAEGAVGAALLVQVLDERLLGAGAVVVDGVLCARVSKRGIGRGSGREGRTLVALRVEDDGGEAADLVLFSEGPVLLVVRVDVGDDALRERSVLMEITR